MARAGDGQADSLFDAAGEEAARAAAPLAVRMRPSSLDGVIGQRHLTGPGTPFRKLGDHDAAMSVVLWGPPGTGKTTLAHVVSEVTRRRFTELSAVTAGVKDVRAAIDAARRDLGLTGTQTVLFIDEVHRFNKAQQDALLPAVENRWVSFIGATTENPFFSVVGPLLSRSLLLTLQPLSDDDIREVISRALADERGLGGSVTLAAGAADHLVLLAGGDARRALTYLESAALGQPAGAEIGLAALERAVDRAAVRSDRGGDPHSDVISAFLKSLRGSDADADLHSLARLNEAWIVTLRDRSHADLLADFRAITAERLASLRAMSPADFNAPSWTPAGNATYARFMQIRIFDCWMHEQDIRAAAGIPGNEGGAIAEQALAEVVLALGYIIGKRGRAPEGSRVQISLAGPIKRDLHVVVDGRAKVVDALDGEPTATVRLSSSLFLRRIGGREDALAARR